KLFPYVKEAAVYKCPSDNSKGGNGPRIRSFSMNSLVGDPGQALDQFNPNYVQVFKMTQFARPADTFVFLEEHPDTIHFGLFANFWDDNFWTALPASYHNRSANLHFADGHVESRHWACADTGRPAVKGGAGVPFVPKSATDWDWLKQRAGVRKQ
ncbi:MAG: prepilin-type cleavage/methylation domain-containing protein, partial [Candidatus Omnitrophica bacterium]|nr:prepilin-type cleavage/methylation domain-containing protein [Candidatus Omnitrophota bacterium]